MHFTLFFGIPEILTVNSLLSLIETSLSVLSEQKQAICANLISLTAQNYAPV